jgi:hypothetical protein
MNVKSCGKVKVKAAQASRVAISGLATAHLLLLKYSAQTPVATTQYVSLRLVLLLRDPGWEHARLAMGLYRWSQIR